MRNILGAASMVGLLAFSGNAFADRGFVGAVHNGTVGECFTFELIYSGDKSHADGAVQTFVIPFPETGGWIARNTVIAVNGAYFSGGKTTVGLRPDGGTATCQGMQKLPTFNAFSSPPIADQ